MVAAALLSACGGKTEAPCDSCAIQTISSTDAIAAMRAAIPASVQLLVFRNIPADHLLEDGTSEAWRGFFQSDDSHEAWGATTETSNGTTTVSTEVGEYDETCAGPGATDLPSTELVADAIRRFKAIPLPPAFEKDLGYWVEAPCVVAKDVDTPNAIVTGHYIMTQWKTDRFYLAWSYYDDQGQFYELCGPCDTSSPGNCTACTR